MHQVQGASPQTQTVTVAEIGITYIDFDGIAGSRIHPVQLAPIGMDYQQPPAAGRSLDPVTVEDKRAGHLDKLSAQGNAFHRRLIGQAATGPQRQAIEKGLERIGKIG